MMRWCLLHQHSHIALAWSHECHRKLAAFVFKTQTMPHPSTRSSQTSHLHTPSAPLIPSQHNNSMCFPFNLMLGTTRQPNAVRADISHPLCEGDLLVRDIIRNSPPNKTPKRPPSSSVPSGQTRPCTHATHATTPPTLQGALAFTICRFVTVRACRTHAIIARQKTFNLYAKHVSFTRMAAATATATTSHTQQTPIYTNTHKRAVGSLAFGTKAYTRTSYGTACASCKPDTEYMLCCLCCLPFYERIDNMY